MDRFIQKPREEEVAMLNPKDVENIDTVEGQQEFSEEMLAEFSNGKGDDEEDEPNVQQ